mmetsp:Transcript_26643/g.78734  ORF Transcript_26643/g.78734 Transcript_26643/m.78734 type:complete len:133 (-) Transcript_26643:229-627(-)
MQALPTQSARAPGIENQTLQQLAENVADQTTVLERFRDDRLTASENKTGFTNLHPNVQNMILNASSDYVTVASPSESCKKFFDTSSAGKAENFLFTELKDVYGCVVDIATGTSTVIHGGSFLRDQSDSPNNF